MRRASGPLKPPRLLSSLLLGLTILAFAVPTASAEPSTNERRKVAEEVATSVCQTMPTIPKLPTSVDAVDLCRVVLVENIDPEGSNQGVQAACELALPLPARPAAKFCARALDILLDPARRLFLDKIVPIGQQLACVTAAPAAFDCLAQQVHIWLKQSIISLWQGLIAVLTADTKAISLVDGWTNAGIVSLYSDVGALGATLLLGLMITSLIISAIRFDFRQFGSTLLGVIVWGLFWSGGAVIAVLLMKASDQASRWLAGRPDEAGRTDLSRAGSEFGNWVDYITGATQSAVVHPVYNPGSFTAILICLLLIVSIVITVVALLMRTIALLLIMVLLPLTLAGTAGPRMTREWFTSALRMFVALLLAKPLIVIAVRLGSVLVSVPQRGEPQATFSDALLGVAIILLAGLLPGVIYRFSGGLMSTSAGNPPRAAGGVIHQSSQSAQSSGDMTRMIMERNSPRTAHSRGTAASTGAARAGSGSPSAASGLGAAAGPLGIAAMATAMAGSALESGGRWMTGQAATGGGVLGDVEGPAVPSPPISRVPPHSGARQSSGAQVTGPPTAHATTHPANITVLQTQPEPSSHTPLPSSGPHLVIPGTVVPERDPAQLRTAPKALLPGKDGHHG